MVTMTLTFPSFSSHPSQLDHVPISQVGGLLLIQQQLQKLSVHNSLRSLQELLVNKVEERRGSISHGEERREVAHSPLDLVESWRIAGTSKLIGNRQVAIVMVSGVGYLSRELNSPMNHSPPHLQGSGASMAQASYSHTNTQSSHRTRQHPPTTTSAP